MPETIDTQRRYHRVLHVIGTNTGDPQPLGCRPRTLYQTLVAHGKYDRQGVKASVEAAIANDDLLLWADRDGRTRLTLACESDLRALIGRENQREHPAVDVIEAAAALLEGDDG